MAFHTTLPNHQRRRKSEDGQEAAHHHDHLQVDQSHPAKEVQDVNIPRTRNVDATIPLPVHQIVSFKQISITDSCQYFQIITEEERFWYSIPGDMGKYVNGNFDRFLSEKDLKENILKENPVPRNIDPNKILDHSLAKVVEGRQETLADKDLEAVQSKIRDFLGPICTL